MKNIGINGKKRLHFGVLLSLLTDRCLSDVWSGITRYAKANDIHLTGYISAQKVDIYDNIQATHFNTCFDNICNNTSLDGVIVLGGFIEHIASHKTIMKYVSRIPKHIPVVSITHKIPGIPSIMSDNVGGVFDAVDHLIKVHKRTKIAFVKGTDGHQEVEERFNGYKKALAANSIAFDERYVFSGQFTQKCGQEAVNCIIDMGLPVDAIVGGNDVTAIGVLTELKRRNISVPNDIAICGFDDDIYSAVFSPTISTVRQDYSLIGQTAADTLFQVILGGQVEDVVYVPTVFIARQSCGCRENDLSNIEFIPNAATETSCLEAFVLQEFSSLFKNDVPQHQIHGWTTALVNTIKKVPFDRDIFLHLFEDTLNDFIDYSNDLSKWYDALNILTHSVELYKNEVESESLVLSTLVFAVIYVSNVRFKIRKLEEFNLIDYRVLLREMISSLVLIFDIKSLADELFSSLTELSIGTVLVGLYSNPIKSDNRDSSRAIDTVIGFDAETKFSIMQNTQKPILFSDYSTIDEFDFERERRTFYFLPLFFKDEETGILIIHYDPGLPEDVYELLRVNIATAVKGADLMLKVRTLSVTDELTGLLNRRGFLQFAHSRLLHLHRSGTTPVVVFLDMDGLKHINDAYGHKEGDAALSALAKILKKALRAEDIIGRVGGDEFVILSSVKSNESGGLLINRIRKGLAKYNNKKLHPYIIDASIGCVGLEESTRECFEAALINADSLLYKEKKEKKKRGLSRQ